MKEYNVLASSDESTVVSEYVPEEKKSTGYQSEAQLEDAFISRLERQGYERLDIHDEQGLLDNLRKQMEKLNGTTFTDNEWKTILEKDIANSNDGIVEKTRAIQQDNIRTLVRDDGSCINYMLIDRKNIHHNSLQVLHQYATSQGTHDNRYDVTILVNGLPLVHVELKRRGVDLREAFGQIDRYQRESFWSGSGLFEYVQIFVISNGTYTKYYSNTTRSSHIREMHGARSGKKTSNSFEFTSYWADASNAIIPDLMDFTATFFARHTLLNILTRYCILTSEDLLLVMRPYQITATEKILNRIVLAGNYHKEGTIEAGGYIWHSTGTGKTLTSFKTAQLATQLDCVDRVLFVVDRKDLDYQTMKEYDRFQKGAADGNTSTAVLERQLSGKDEKGNPHDYPIIITTIQKLSGFVKKNAGHKVANERVVIIFDECHRSQFGEMHKQITHFFKKYFLFGFTGTPIFSINASHSASPGLSTTPQLFGDRLHTYTIVDAIRDGNVLPFRIDYVNTMKAKDITDDMSEGISSESALLSMERIRGIVTYTLDNYDRKTRRSKTYELRGRRKRGFNSIFACQSVKAAIRYYLEFKRQIAERGSDLKIATIFSYSPNEEAGDDGILDDEGFSIDGLDATGKEALYNAMKDYDAMFHTAFASSGDFQNYYKDVSMRMKNREIDMLIVVNMFLTGFDATTCSTLWCDKNLKMHGLIQAFSRTNRILNSIKTYGNIVCFRNLQKAVDSAIAVFGDSGASSVVLLRDYDSYYHGYDEDDGSHHAGYSEIADKLKRQYPDGYQPAGEHEEKDFIATFGSLLRVMSILSSFDRFEKEKLLSDREMQDYQSRYIGLYRKYHHDAEKEDIADYITFEMELVKQIEIGIYYILEMVAKHHADNTMDETAEAEILKAADSSIRLQSKKELIARFIRKMNVEESDVDKAWRAFVKESFDKDLNDIITANKLNGEKARAFIMQCLEQGEMKETGTDIDAFLPPVSRFMTAGLRDSIKNNVIEMLRTFIDRYNDIYIKE